MESFVNLEPKADGFRNYLEGRLATTEYLLLDKANLLTLSAPEMTVLVGGLRVLGANYDGSKLGVPTATPWVADQRFLRQPGWTWARRGSRRPRTRTRSRGATPPPARSNGPAAGPTPVLGSNSELRALAEVYASADAKEKFVNDFVAAWNKVMNLDRFDVA